MKEFIKPLIDIIIIEMDEIIATSGQPDVKHGEYNPGSDPEELPF